MDPYAIHMMLGAYIAAHVSRLRASIVAHM